MLSIAAITIASLNGCTNSEAGTPSPSHRTAATTHTTEVGSQADPYGHLDSCDLLDKALDDKDFPPGERVDIESDNGCQAHNPDIAAISLNLTTDATLSRWADEELAHRGSIHGRTAVQEPEGDDGCAVAMKVSSQAIASVGATTDVDTDEACDMVTEVAKKVEPMLPGGE